MHIIIIGAGEVGSYLAQILIEEQHDVSIIEQDEHLARELDTQLDAHIIHGTGVSREALFRAGINRADLLLAITQVDEVNLIAAMTAEKLAPKCKTVARVRDTRYISGTDALKPEEYGVDFLVGPEEALADQVVQLLQYVGPGQISPIADNKAVLLEMPVVANTLPVWATLGEIHGEVPVGSAIMAVLGKKGLRIPEEDDRVTIGERLFFVCKRDEIKALLKVLASDSHAVERVLIIGGGNIGYHVARHLQKKKFNVTVVEKDRVTAERLSVKLKKSVVICADVTEPNTLGEQMGEGQDAVVVALDDDEKSLLTGVMAKHLGADKVIARVDKREYAPLAHKLGLDAVVSPRRAVADAILRFVRRGNINSTTMLGDHEGEFIDFTMNKDSKNSGKPISEIKLPADSRIAMIVRKDQVLFPRDRSETIEAGDHVFIVALRTAVAGLEDIFE